MANTSSTIQIIFEGAVRGVRQAAAAVEAAVRSVDDRINRHRASLAAFDKGMAAVDRTLLGLVKGFLAFGGAAASIQTVVAVSSALVSILAQLAPAALALPGIFLGLGVAFGTAKLALSGFTDAVKGDAEALANFSAEGQKTVLAVRGLEGGFKAMRTAVQQSFFKGLAEEVKLTGGELLTLGKERLPAVAAGLNQVFLNAIRVARTETFKGALATIMDNTARATENASGSLAAFLHGFLRLGEIGSKFLPGLGKAIDSVALKFNAWVNAGAESDRIEAMINRAIAGFKTLGNILGDVGAGLGKLFAAFNQGLTGGGGTLESIERVTQAFRELSGTSEAQAAMKALGETVRVLGDAFRNVLTAAVRELGPVIVAVAPFVQELATVIGEKLVRTLEFVGPLLKSFATFLSENRAVIAPLVSVLLTLWTAFKVGRTVVGGVSRALDGYRKAADFLARHPAILRNIGNAFRFLASRAGLMAAGVVVAIDVVIGAIKGFSEEVNKAFEEGDFGQDILTFWEEFKKEPFQAIGKELRASLTPPPTAAADFKKIGDSFKRDFVDVVIGAGAEVGRFFTETIPGFFTESIPQALSGIGTSIDQFFTGGFRTAFSNISTIVTTGLQSVVGLFTNLPSLVGGPISALNGSLSAGFSSAMAAAGSAVATGINNVISFFSGLPARASSFLSGFGATVSNGFRTTMSNAATTVASGIAAVIGFFSQLPGRIAGIVASVLASVVNGFRNMMANAATLVANGITRVVGFFTNLRSQAASIIASVSTTVVNGFRTAMTNAANAVSTGISRVVGFFRNLPGQILGILSGLAGSLFTSGFRMLDSFAAGIRSAGERAYQAALAAVARVRSVFPFSPAKTGPFSGRGYVTYSGRALATDFADAIRRGIPGVAAAARALATAARAATTLPDLGPALAAATNLGSSLNPAGPAALPPTATQLSTALAATPPPITNVTVKIGETELRQIVETVIENVNREVARVVGAGTGRG